MVSQSLINGIAAGSLVAILGIGYAIIARSGLTYHFVHAAAFTFGAYCFQLGTIYFPDALFLSVTVGCFAAALVGVGTEALVYRVLRARKASRLIFILASFGLYIVLQNIISLCLGDASRPVGLWPVTEGWRVLGGRITGLQIIAIVSAATMLSIGSWWTRKTKMGRTARAIGSNPKLAEIVGINTLLSLCCVMGIGSICAGLAGVISACDTGVFPTMGLMPFFAALVGVMAGGYSLTGTTITCVGVGILQQLVVLWTGAEWQDAIVFAVLILLLLFRPQGFFGKEIKNAAA